MSYRIVSVLTVVVVRDFGCILFKPDSLLDQKVREPLMGRALAQTRKSTVKFSSFH